MAEPLTVVACRAPCAASRGSCRRHLHRLSPPAPHPSSSSPRPPRSVARLWVRIERPSGSVRTTSSSPSIRPSTPPALWGVPAACGHGTWSDHLRHPEILWLTLMRSLKEAQVKAREGLAWKYKCAHGPWWK